MIQDGFLCFLTKIAPILRQEGSASERVRLDGRKMGALIKNENKSTENLKEDKKRKYIQKNIPNKKK